MAPKLKPIGELGFVAQEQCGQWRACACLCGKMVRGPSRPQKSAAQADLQMARSASTRADMAVVLDRLKTEAANVSAPHAAVVEEQAETSCQGAKERTTAEHPEEIHTSHT